MSGVHLRREELQRFQSRKTSSHIKMSKHRNNHSNILYTFCLCTIVSVVMLSVERRRCLKVSSFPEVIASHHGTSIFDNVQRSMRVWCSSGPLQSESARKPYRDSTIWNVWSTVCTPPPVVCQRRGRQAENLEAAESSAAAAVTTEQLVHFQNTDQDRVCVRVRSMCVCVRVDVPVCILRTQESACVYYIWTSIKTQCKNIFANSTFCYGQH